MDETRDDGAGSAVGALTAVSTPPQLMDSVIRDYQPMIGRITENQLIKARQ
jgi:hypothetical protein